jgi:dolichyl-diphosphooligosaccharide--protein glycosyltransferase
MRSAAIVTLAVALAFAVRVAPAYHAVFGASRVSFQDNDSWEHMRGVQNLVSHFPSQSRFDPYAVFPGGESRQPDPWNLTLASVAWGLGAGKPSDSLVDQVGAWLPAVLGALLPIPVYLLGRRLFGQMAGQLSAVAVAVIPGTLLWETHLGVPDHHVAECLLSFLVLLFLCEAAGSQGRRRIWLSVLAGVALGAYLCVRPAGIFVPGTLALAAFLESALAPIIIGALALAGALFSLSAGGPWARFTWLSLGGSILACGLVWALGELWLRKGWRRASLFPAACLGASIAVGLVAVIKPATFFALIPAVGRYLPGGSDAGVLSTRELYPLWRVEPRGIGGVFSMLGGVWVIGLPYLFCVLPVVLRSRRPALILFAVWGLVMTIAGTLQVRMLVYSGPILALAAGAGAVWFIDRIRIELIRKAAPAAFALFFVVTSLPAGIRQAQWSGGPDSGWFAALDWLRRNTPEPMATANAWNRLWPGPRPGEIFAYPDAAYGVLTWWDYGDWVNSIAHRLPSANGNQSNALSVATFLTATGEMVARGQLSQLRARYIVLNPPLVLNLWPAIVLWAKQDAALYRKTLYGAGPGGGVMPVTVYLPDYYRSMAVHLYTFDGRRVNAPSEVSVFTSRPIPTLSGGEAQGLIAVRKFPSLQRAYDYMAANSGENMTLGSTDPAVSCVELEDLSWVRRVFTSDETLPRPNRLPAAVKVFEVTQ